jgi:hypothetical protein
MGGWGRGSETESLQLVEKHITQHYEADTNYLTAALKN